MGLHRLKKKTDDIFKMNTNKHPSTLETYCFKSND